MTTPENPSAGAGSTGHMEIVAWGSGIPVILIPSLGRGSDDFTALGERLADAGYCAICPNPRGINGTTGSFDGIDIFDLAADVVWTISASRAAPVHLVGHQFGGHVARAVAFGRPELVRSVTLLGCPGEVEGDPEALDAMDDSFDDSLPDDERLAAIADAFFAEESDPAAWSEGWWPDSAEGQAAALEATNEPAFRTAGRAPILVIQGADDRISPRESGYALAAELPGRVEVVEIEGAGYALLPEQPEAVFNALIGYLRRRDAPERDNSLRI